jgi:transposase
MGKRKYRAVDVKDASVEELLSRLASDRVVIGIDVAKHNMFATVMDEAQKVHGTIRWRHPDETRAFVAHLVAITGIGGEIEVAMEPSGVYGDALRFEIERAGFQVFRVSPKRVHDAREVYDGVSSLHDAKAAAIVAKLHLDGGSRRWAIRTEQERELDAAVRGAEIFGKQFEQNRNRLEALVARHWPELTEELELSSKTLLELLARFGGPSAVADELIEARTLMQKTGRGGLARDKIERVLATAGSTVGQPQIAAERRLVQMVAGETRRNQVAVDLAGRAIEKLTEKEGSVRELRGTIGKRTAAVVVAAAGDPRAFDSAKAWVKNLGLNMRENTSGESKALTPAGLHITKRGSALARMQLYLATLRVIQKDAVVRTWYAQKVDRMGGKHKPVAVVAVMRKLAAALWHVAKGEKFDATKLFDLHHFKKRRRAAHEAT